MRARTFSWAAVRTFCAAVEIYKGKVIFYSLGNFIFENWLMVPQPTDFYEHYGVGPEALPAEAYAARSDHGRRDEPADPIYWKRQPWRE